MTDRPLPPAGMLVHLSTNLWNDSPTPLTAREGPPEPFYSPRMRFDLELWHEMTTRMAEAGLAYVLLDLGDAVAYESHPEIAVDGAWSIAQLREELDRLRDLDLEPLPKLNFSTAHDAWMGDYARRVSAPEYYPFCSELIDEVVRLFDGPRLFHIGMDEETQVHQRTYPQAIIRQHSLWWHDLEFFIACVEQCGSRAWMWSDYGWHHPDFFRKVSARVVQSNWHYTMNFTGGSEADRPRVIDMDEQPPPTYLSYLDLDDAGLAQIPTGSTWEDADNFVSTVAFGQERLGSDQVLGYLQTTWRRMVPQWRGDHLASIDAIVRSRQQIRAGAKPRPHRRFSSASP